jgi:hypothetical protein
MKSGVQEEINQKAKTIDAGSLKRMIFYKFLSLAQRIAETAFPWFQITTGLDRSQVDINCPVSETPLERSLTSGLSLGRGGIGW